MPEHTAERKYALTKLQPGDYLLPSNDARTLWRLSRYADPEFVGQTHGWELRRTSVADFERLVDNAWDDPLDWSHWDYWGGGYRTRAEAIAETLHP